LLTTFGFYRVSRGDAVLSQLSVRELTQQMTAISLLPPSALLQHDSVEEVLELTTKATDVCALLQKALARRLAFRASDGADEAGADEAGTAAGGAVGDPDAAGDAAGTAAGAGDVVAPGADDDDDDDDDDDVSSENDDRE
jgi:hypothetical protein